MLSSAEAYALISRPLTHTCDCINCRLNGGGPVQQQHHQLPPQAKRMKQHPPQQQQHQAQKQQQQRPFPQAQQGHVAEPQYAPQPHTGKAWGGDGGRGSGGPGRGRGNGDAGHGRGRGRGSGPNPAVAAPQYIDTMPMRGPGPKLVPVGHPGNLVAVGGGRMMPGPGGLVPVNTGGLLTATGTLMPASGGLPLGAFTAPGGGRLVPVSRGTLVPVHPSATLLGPTAHLVTGGLTPVARPAVTPVTALLPTGVPVAAPSAMRPDGATRAVGTARGPGPRRKAAKGVGRGRGPGPKPRNPGSMSPGAEDDEMDGMDEDSGGDGWDAGGAQGRGYVQQEYERYEEEHVVEDAGDGYDVDGYARPGSGRPGPGGGAGSRSQAPGSGGAGAPVRAGGAAASTKPSTSQRQGGPVDRAGGSAWDSGRAHGRGRSRSPPGRHGSPLAAARHPVGHNGRGASPTEGQRRDTRRDVDVRRGGGRDDGDDWDRGRDVRDWGRERGRERGRSSRSRSRSRSRRRGDSREPAWDRERDRGRDARGSRGGRSRSPPYRSRSHSRGRGRDRSPLPPSRSAGVAAPAAAPRGPPAHYDAAPPSRAAGSGGAPYTPATTSAGVRGGAPSAHYAGDGAAADGRGGYAPQRSAPVSVAPTGQIAQGQVGGYDNYHPPHASAPTPRYSGQHPSAGAAPLPYGMGGPGPQDGSGSGSGGYARRPVDGPQDGSGSGGYARRPVDGPQDGPGSGGSGYARRPADGPQHHLPPAVEPGPRAGGYYAMGGQAPAQGYAPPAAGDMRGGMPYGAGGSGAGSSGGGIPRAANSSGVGGSGGGGVYPPHLESYGREAPPGYGGAGAGSSRSLVRLISSE